MSKKQQEVLQTAANHLEDERWKEAPAQTEEYEQKLEDYGVQIINFTDEELDAFYERCQKEVWPKLTELYGQEAVDMVQNLTK